MVSFLEILTGTFATNQIFVLTQNVNTYNLCVAVSASGLELGLPLWSWSVPVQSVLHLRLPAVLLEDVLLLELVLLLGDDSRQFEEQPHIINIVSSDAPSRWESQQLIFEPISREKSHPVHHTLVPNKTTPGRARTGNI